MSGRVCQLRATPWCVTIISWPSCLLASAQGAFSHSLSPCHSSQVNRPQAIRGNYCTCSCSLDSMNEEKMISSAKVYCHFNFLAGSLIFVAFKMKVNYPVLSHFQFSGRERSGTWKKFGTGWVPGFRRTLATSQKTQISIHSSLGIFFWTSMFIPVVFVLSRCVGSWHSMKGSPFYCLLCHPQPTMSTVPPQCLLFQPQKKMLRDSFTFTWWHEILLCMRLET